MLAAECAWAVLRAEHARIRDSLAEIDRAIRADGWASGEQARALVELVERLQAFDEAAHRPKGVVLFSLLHGRSAETDDLLDRLATMRGRCDHLVSQVLSKLRAALSGVVGAAEGVDALLEEHRTLTLAHLDAEDTFLHSQSAAHLTRDEWAAVASSISDAMPPTKK